MTVLLKLHRKTKAAFSAPKDLLKFNRQSSRVDRSSLRGKVMCGYQGWFSCSDDQQGLGWRHWAKDPWKPMAPGNASFDLWPDVSELREASLFATDYHHADGRPAKLFSSASPDVVAMHFRWMRAYGLDGIFLQRFATELNEGRIQRQRDRMLGLVQSEALANGRVFALMYDLVDSDDSQLALVLQDWQYQRESRGFDSCTSYLHHDEKPLVALWGVGFSDGRNSSLDACTKLIEALKREGCTVLLGTPSWWRSGKNDATNDPKMLNVIKNADIISPWSVGRYHSPRSASLFAKAVWRPDLEWCAEHGVEFMPVIFPGFSWHQMKGETFDAIPRLGGEFLWSQVFAAHQNGCEMLYVAMFDELDEATAIFKCDPDPPVSGSEQFLSLQETAPDHYLYLVGQARKGLRGEVPITSKMPVRDL
ncbi:glycoside hydrolase family 71/99-like protein [Alphaproteobacteria bacterium]|nr:glycoside hydrolase family 71/99-like protein [Alphaproteobacteria bacterium]